MTNEMRLSVISNQVDKDLGEMVEREMRTVVPHRSARIPNYVEHDPKIDDVGRLSSEALVMTYEESAKQIEAMGQGLIEGLKECQRSSLQMVKELERVHMETDDAVHQCMAAAEVYREQARDIFKQIQNRAMLAARVRETAASMIADLK